MKKIIAALFVVVVLAAVCFFLFRTNRYSQKIISVVAPNKTRQITIEIQPFDDLPPQESKYVLSKMKKIYSNTILLTPTKLPANSFYAPRNRYRADTIIQWLSRHTQQNCVTVALTSKDISTNKDDIKDWGVMGLGFQPGNACVVSTYRLKKENLLSQLFKVVIHELGHTQGLAHCENKTCFMRDAEGHNTTDEENEFCPRCKKVLERKGWVFAN